MGNSEMIVQLANSLSAEVGEEGQCTKTKVPSNTNMATSDAVSNVHFTGSHMMVVVLM
jgi:hypothetical protein